MDVDVQEGLGTRLSPLINHKRACCGLLHLPSFEQLQSYPTTDNEWLESPRRCQRCSVKPEAAICTEDTGGHRLHCHQFSLLPDYDAATMPERSSGKHKNTRQFEPESTTTDQALNEIQLDFTAQDISYSTPNSEQEVVQSIEEDPQEVRSSMFIRSESDKAVVESSASPASRS
jgi:hypothetical protein